MGFATYNNLWYTSGTWQLNKSPDEKNHLQLDVLRSLIYWKNLNIYAAL